MRIVSWIILSLSCTVASFGVEPIDVALNDLKARKNIATSLQGLRDSIRAAGGKRDSRDSDPGGAVPWNLVAAELDAVLVACRDDSVALTAMADVLAEMPAGAVERDGPVLEHFVQAVQKDQRALAPRSVRLIDQLRWRSVVGADHLLWAWREFPDLHRDIRRIIPLCYADDERLADLAYDEFMSLPPDKWTTDAQRTVREIKPGPRHRDALMRLAVAVLADPAARWIAVAVLGHGSLPYQKILMPMDRDRLRGLSSGEDATAATLAVWLLATIGGPEEIAWLQNQAPLLFSRFRPTAAFIKRLDTDVTIRRLPTLGLFALLGGRVALAQLDPASGDGMGIDADGQAGWWSLALHAEGGGPKALAQLKGWSEAELTRNLQRTTYGKALVVKAAREGDGEPPPHIASQYGQSLVTDLQILADFPRWTKGTVVVEATISGTDIPSQNALVQLLINLGDGSARFRNVPGMDEWIAHIPPQMTAAKKCQLLQALAMSTDLVVPGLVAEVELCGKERLWDGAIPRLCSINPAHPALDGLARRYAASSAHLARFCAWLLGACRGQVAALPSEAFPVDLLTHRDADALLSAVSESVAAKAGQSLAWRNPQVIGDPTRSEFRRRLAVWLGILDRLDKVLDGPIGGP